MILPRHRHRIVLLTIFILAGTGVLLSRLHTYQITKREEFVGKLPKNYEVLIREPGIRGIILDRNGVPLATNKRNYEISFNLKQVHQAYLSDLENKVEDVPEGLEDINSIVNQYLRPRLRKKESADSSIGLSISLDRPGENIPGLVSHYNTHGGLIPFTFRHDLSYDEFAHAAENNVSLPGVYISVRPQRQYPFGSLASHVLGYVSQWAKGDIPEGYKHYIGDEKGVNGVERTMDEFLRGTEAVRTISRDLKGKTQRLIDKKRRGSGAKVTLTIDAEAQYLAEEVLKIVGRASAVVMDPHTGEVLALASTPDYNPNDFIPSIHPDTVKAYNGNRANPFNNAAIKNYTPGSTFKLPTALSAALNGKAKISHDCVGYIQYGNFKCRCWKTSGHGPLALSEAIQRSCNPYFMNLAAQITPSKLVKDLESLGFGKKTGIRLPGESAGIVPGNRAWKRADRRNRLTPAISGMTTIGQQDTECTPLQMATLVCSIANRGHLYAPRIIREISHPDKVIAFPNRPNLKLNLLQSGVSIEDLELIRSGMHAAANKAGGTAGPAALDDIQIAAKTGTAQTTDHGLATNISWTVAFAPYDQPKYVVAVAVRRGTSGGKVAGPLAKLIFEGLFARDAGYKIPLKRQQPPLGHFDIINEIILPEENRLDILFGPPISPEEATPENSIQVINPSPEEEEGDR